MKIGNLEIEDAQLYCVFSSLDVKVGISIRVKALTLAVKKEKSWMFPHAEGNRKIKIDCLGKIDDTKFTTDTLFNNLIPVF